MIETKDFVYTLKKIIQMITVRARTMTALTNKHLSNAYHESALVIDFAHATFG